MRHLEGLADVDVPAPQVDDWLMPAWRCWHRLNLDRPWYGGGFGPMVPGRIPWSAVRDWAEFHAMSGEDFTFLDRCVREMDSMFIEFSAAKREAEAAARAAPRIIRP